MDEFTASGCLAVHLSRVLRAGTEDLRLAAAVSQERAELLWDKYEPRPLKFLEQV